MHTLNKKSLVKTAFAAVSIALLLTGCSSQNSKASADVSPKVSSKAQSESSPGSPGVQASPSATSNDILSYYISLLGLSKDQIISKMNEEPTTVDEGGLEFAKAGIRVWFDEETYKYVNQVYTANKDIDLNGAKIGDNISVFKAKFGTPVSDKNGDMHFKYKNAYLSVVYDLSTEKTIALYVLKDNF